MRSPRVNRIRAPSRTAVQRLATAAQILGDRKAVPPLHWTPQEVGEWQRSIHCSRCSLRNCGSARRGEAAGTHAPEAGEAGDRRDAGGRVSRAPGGDARARHPARAGVRASWSSRIVQEVRGYAGADRGWTGEHRRGRRRSGARRGIHCGRAACGALRDGGLRHRADVCDPARTRGMSSLLESTLDDEKADRREAHGDCGSDGESGSRGRARVQPARSPKRDRAHGGMAGIDRGCRGQSDGPACGSFEGQSTAGSERLHVTRRFQRGTGARAIHRREAARHELACCQRDGRDTPAAARISRRAQGAQGTQSALTSVLDDDVGPDRRPDARLRIARRPRTRRTRPFAIRYTWRAATTVPAPHTSPARPLNTLPVAFIISVGLGRVRARSCLHNAIRQKRAGFSPSQERFRLRTRNPAHMPCRFLRHSRYPFADRCRRCVQCHVHSFINSRSQVT